MTPERKHLIVSLVKSAVRIITCVIAYIFKSVEILAIGMGLAEGIGIVEELIL